MKVCRDSAVYKPPSCSTGSVSQDSLHSTAATGAKPSGIDPALGASLGEASDGSVTRGSTVQSTAGTTSASGRWSAGGCCAHPVTSSTTASAPGQLLMPAG